MTNPFALIVEDDPKLAFIFGEALQMADFEVEVVQDGRTALDRLAVTTPTVVVLDLHLPLMSGVDILTYIRANERLIQTKVILATADAIRAEKLRGKADLVLLKPISFNQLSTLARRFRPTDTPAENKG
jgi:DNA-binding response OmpR family regulator